jgi:hypothetical protein
VTLRENQPLHDSLKELRECGLRNCLLCALIWHGIPPHDQEQWVARDSETDCYMKDTQQYARHRSQLLCKLETSSRSNEMRLTIHSTTAPPLNDILPGFGVDFKLYRKSRRTDNPPHTSLQSTLIFPLDPGRHTDLTPVKPQGPCETTSSSAALAHVTHWVMACQMAHYECRAEHGESWMPQRESWMPSRLIYVGRTDCNVHLVMRPSEVQRYMTLSHCWGQGPTLKLTGDLLDEFIIQIPLHALPQTYLDAIMVTRHLGVEYLWIDSLCIIQDSMDDWRRECAQMSNVYKNSYCNIAALESIDSHGGLFSARDPNLLRPLIVKTAWDRLPNIMWCTKFQLREKHYYEEIGSAPLHQRAWVLQERLLSPRNLHFGKHMIYWECRRSIASENMEPQEGHSYHSPVFWWPKEVDIWEALRRWYSMVENYTKACLTYPEDRLVAISALAKVTKRILDSGLQEGCIYLAGLWSCHIAEQLLWYVLPLDPAIAKPLAYRAPSWSWVSVDSQVHFHWNGPDQWGRNLLIKIHKATVASSFNDEYIQVADGYIQVDCYLWKLPSGSCSKELVGYGINLTIRWDTHETSTNTNFNALYLMPIKFELHLNSYYDSEDSDDSEVLFGSILGLLITPTSDYHRFQRVASFEVTAYPSEPPFAELPASHDAGEEWFRCIGGELLEQKLALSKTNDRPTTSGVKEQEADFWSQYKVELI